jgi:hypothetical protein
MMWSEKAESVRYEYREVRKIVNLQKWHKKSSFFAGSSPRPFTKLIRSGYGIDRSRLFVLHAARRPSTRAPDDRQYVCIMADGVKK